MQAPCIPCRHCPVILGLCLLCCLLALLMAVASFFAINHGQGACRLTTTGGKEGPEACEGGWARSLFAPPPPPAF